MCVCIHLRKMEENWQNTEMVRENRAHDLDSLHSLVLLKTRDVGFGRAVINEADLALGRKM